MTDKYGCSFVAKLSFFFFFEKIYVFTKFAEKCFYMEKKSFILKIFY